MENPDLVLQETGSSPTHSRLNCLTRDCVSTQCIPGQDIVTAIHSLFDILEISHNEANESTVVKLAICGILIIGLKLFYVKMCTSTCNSRHFRLKYRPLLIILKFLICNTH